MVKYKILRTVIPYLNVLIHIQMSKKMSKAILKLSLERFKILFTQILKKMNPLVMIMEVSTLEKLFQGEQVLESFWSKAPSWRKTKMILKSQMF